MKTAVKYASVVANYRGVGMDHRVTHSQHSHIEQIWQVTFWQSLHGNMETNRSITSNPYVDRKRRMWHAGGMVRRAIIRGGACPGVDVHRRMSYSIVSRGKNKLKLHVLTPLVMEEEWMSVLKHVRRCCWMHQQQEVTDRNDVINIDVTFNHSAK